MNLALRVARIDEECASVKSFVLVAPRGDALPDFTAGAHVNVAVQLPCGNKAWRSYSLAGNPADRFQYVIAVLLEKEGSGGSDCMHRNVKTGDILEVSEPKNHFPLAEEATEHLLIAGGIGITPIISMAWALATTDKRFEVHYSARASETMAFRGNLTSLCGPRATLYFDGGVPANGIDLRTLLHSRRVGQHVYVCGPRKMIEDVRRTCTDFGWPTESVDFELFAAATPAEHREPIEVFLARSKVLQLVPPGVSILDALIEAGIHVDYDCKRGECGVCSVAILEGIPLHMDYYLSERERSGNKVMQICVSWAKTQRLVLDL